jgi:hypothetical protein
MAIPVPVPGEFIAAMGTFAATFAATIAASTAAMVGSDTAADVGTKVNWLTKFLDSKAKWVLDKTESLRKHIQSLTQRMIQFNKFMIVMARFLPIIKVFIAILLIFTNLLMYVILAFAWFAVAILEVGYFVVSLPPFIYLVFLVYFFIVDCIPFIIYTILFLSLLVIVTFLCISLAFLDMLTGGSLKVLILCQNSPAAWYKTPAHHLYNSYSRGLLCSKPCKKGYAPDTTGTSCVRTSRNTPPYCAQAEVMRLYSGDGKKDRKFAYGDFRTKANIKYLMKTPTGREDMLLDHFTKRQQHYDKCGNPENAMGMSKYDNITMNICSNLDAIKSTKDLHGMTDKEIKKLEIVCGQSFCDSRSSYPFCAKLSKVSDINLADLIKKIIMAIIGIIIFSITLVFLFAYMNDE